MALIQHVLSFLAVLATMEVGVSSYRFCKYKRGNKKQLMESSEQEVRSLVEEPEFGFCSEKEDGFYAHPNCRRFRLCEGGKTFTSFCPPGLYFNGCKGGSGSQSRCPATTDDKPGHSGYCDVPEKSACSSKSGSYGEDETAASRFLSETKTCPRNVCYFTNWSKTRNGARFYPKDIDGSLCTHIIYAFADLKNNKLMPHEWDDILVDGKDGHYQQVLELRKANPGLKVLLAVGGWHQGSKPFSAMVKSAAGRKTFIETAMTHLRKYDFDGLDLDWNFPAQRGSPPEDKQRFAELVKEIRTMFKKESVECDLEELMLTAAVAPKKEIIDAGYDVDTLKDNLDFINVMAYDFGHSDDDSADSSDDSAHSSDDSAHSSDDSAHSSDDSAHSSDDSAHSSDDDAHSSDDDSAKHTHDKAWHVAPLYASPKGNQEHSLDFAAKYWADKGFPKDKIVIGITAYGHSYNLTTADSSIGAPATNGPAMNKTRYPGYMAYYEVCTLISQGAKIKRLSTEKVPVLVKDNLMVTYDDPESVKGKAQYVKDKGYGGIMLWALDLDDFTGTNCNAGKYPILNAIHIECPGPEIEPEEPNGTGTEDCEEEEEEEECEDEEEGGEEGEEECEEEEEEVEDCEDEE